MLQIPEKATDSQHWKNGSRNPDTPARAADPMEGIKSAIGGGGFVRLTAAQAGQIVRECRYERQHRDLGASADQHIRVLCDLMRRDKWRSMEKLDFALLDGRLIILNGHHRLAAQTSSGKKIEWVVVVHKCATIQDVAGLYYTFDTNVRGRTASQILSASDFSDVMGITKSLTEAVWRAVPLLASNFEFKAPDPLYTRVIDQRLEIMKAYQNEAERWAKAIDPSVTKLRSRLCTQGAVAVALVTFRCRRHEAYDFWRSVAENDGLAKGSPQHAYVMEITSNMAARGSASVTARTAAAAWNAFYEGRTMRGIRIYENSPLTIAGTPIGK